MKKIILHNGITLILMEVPKDANTFTINKVGCVRYQRGFHNGWNTAIEPEQLGFYAEEDNCEIIGVASTLTNEQVEPFVEKVIIRYDVPARHVGFLDREMFKNHLVEKQYGNAFNTALESFNSLLEANNIDLNREYVILKLLN